MNLPRRVYKIKQKEKPTYKERLIDSKSIDLSDNHTIEDLGNGYCKITPIDINKLVTENTFK